MTMLRLLYTTLILSPAAGALIQVMASGKKTRDAVALFQSPTRRTNTIVDLITIGDSAPIAMVSANRMLLSYHKKQITHI